MDKLFKFVEDMTHSLSLHHTIQTKALKKWVMIVDDIYLNFGY